MFVILMICHSFRVFGYFGFRHFFLSRELKTERVYRFYSSISGAGGGGVADFQKGVPSSFFPGPGRFGLGIGRPRIFDRFLIPVVGNWELLFWISGGGISGCLEYRPPLSG